MGNKKELKIQDSDKLNVLCLHGYRQNEASFSSKTGSFRKFLKSYVNFTYISAKHLSKPLTPEDEVDENQRSWWFNADDGSFKGTNVGGPAFGFEDSLKLVEEVWSKGNFQGIIGFSQGASFASLICSMSQRNCE
jgi:predicted esterase